MGEKGDVKIAYLNEVEEFGKKEGKKNDFFQSSWKWTRVLTINWLREVKDSFYFSASSSSAAVEDVPFLESLLRLA